MKCERCNKEYDAFPAQKHNLCKECIKWITTNSEETNDCIILKCGVCDKFIGYLHIEDAGLVNSKEIMQVFKTNKVYFACPKCIASKTPVFQKRD